MMILDRHPPWCYYFETFYCTTENYAILLNELMLNTELIGSTSSLFLCIAFSEPWSCSKHNDQSFPCVSAGTCHVLYSFTCLFFLIHVLPDGSSHGFVLSDRWVICKLFERNGALKQRWIKIQRLEANESGLIRQKI